MKTTKPFRRVVTGHNTQGGAVFTDDRELTPEMIGGGDAAFATIWATESVPADLNDPRDGREISTGLTLEQGSVIRVVDMFPGEESPMHRTSSIDYGIVLEGEVELELDDGVTKTIGAGGIIIQRGTVHLWRNPSADQICRIVFVLIEAAPYLHNGVPLSDLKPEDVSPAHR